MSNGDRDEDAYRIRRRSARLAKHRRGYPHPTNGEEGDYNNRYIGNYSKGLKHFPLTNSRAGEVDPDEYDKLREGDFDDIIFINPPNEAVKLTNPQAGLAFDLEGPDSHDMGIRKPPRIDKKEGEAAGEMAELYWMALCRDILFRDYDGSNPTTPVPQAISDAVYDLDSNTNYRDFPHIEVGLLTEIGDDIGDKIFATKFEIPVEARSISKTTIFRGFTKGDRKGPYISQFLWKDVPWGTQLLEQIQFELNMYDFTGVKKGKDYLTDYARWLKIQDGFKDVDFMTDDINNVDKFKRHILTGRDIAYYVHRDQLYQAYLHACLILLGEKYPFDPDCPFDSLLPYQDPSEFPTEMGFITFGGPHILSLVTEVATRAAKAVWYQKWFIHRRLRPEAFGGLIHRQLNNTTSPPLTPGLSAKSTVSYQ